MISKKCKQKCLWRVIINGNNKLDDIDWEQNELLAEILDQKTRPKGMVTGMVDDNTKVQRGW